MKRSSSSPDTALGRVNLHSPLAALRVFAFARLRVGIRIIEEEDRNLLVWFPADVKAAVHAVGRLIPVRLARSHWESLPWRAVAVLDRQGITAQNNRDSVVRVPMPRRPPTRSQALAPDENGAPSPQNFLGRGRSCWVGHRSIIVPRTARASRPQP